jgi:hypothetical protein
MDGMDAASDAAARRAGDRASVSACIIARDEAEVLPACLASVAFCDEVVVVDSGSADGTPRLAERAGARVVYHQWLGFARQRNIAIDHARSDWILEVDADERIGEALRAEIEGFLADPPEGVDLAALPCRQHFLGHRLSSAAKYPLYRHRLFRRGTYRHDENRTVHEGLIPAGRVHPFAGDLDHVLARDLREALGDMWRHARLEAGQMTAPASAGHVLKGVVLRPLAKVGWRLVVDGGWRDGWAGLVKIVLDASSDSIVWIRYGAGRTRERGDSGVAPGMHFGARVHHRGPPRIVAVALGARAAREAAAWLASAPADADLALVTDSPPAGVGVRVRHAGGAGPLSVVRALGAEAQLRTADAVVPFGRRAERFVPRLPEALRGAAPPIDPSRAPLPAVMARIAAAREPAA